MAGKVWQWQHVGNKVGKTGRCWTCCVGAHSRDRGYVRCAHTSHVARRMHTIDAGRVHDLSSVLHPRAEAVRIHKQMWLFWCACHRAPADKRIARRGCTWGCRRDRTNNGPRAWSGSRVASWKGRGREGDMSRVHSSPLVACLWRSVVRGEPPLMDLLHTL